jgi:hypothetical protein
LAQETLLFNSFLALVLAQFLLTQQADFLVDLFSLDQLDQPDRVAQPDHVAQLVLVV